MSGQLVTGMPLAVAAGTSTKSVPTLSSAMILHFSNPLTTFRDKGMSLVMMASASCAPAKNSSSDAAGTSLIS